MKALSVLVALPALALTACEPQKPESPTVKAPVQEAKEMGDPPLTMETLKVEVVKSDLADKDAVCVEFQVKFSNKGQNYIEFLNHPYSRRIELQNEAGKNVYPLIAIKHVNPTPLDVVRLAPGEEKTLNFSSLATSSKELGQDFKARMVYTRGSLGSLVPNMGGLSMWQEWPTRPVEGAWQKVSTKEVAPRNQQTGEPKVEFLGVDCVPRGDPDLKGIGFRAKYRITNNSPKTIVHLNRPDGLGFVVSGSKGEYANPYAAMNMTAMSVWDAVVLGPGESKLCSVSTPEYSEPGMERTVKVKFSFSPWNPKFIEGLEESDFPNDMTAWPTKPVQSPVYEVERRL